MTPPPRPAVPAPLAAFDPAALQRCARRRTGSGPPPRARNPFPPVVPLPAAGRFHRRPARRRHSNWCRELAAEGIGALLLPAEYGGRGDYAAFTAAFETIAFHDISLTIKFTVQFGLWAGSILLLGTRGTPPPLPARHRFLRAARLFRTDRDRPRLQRPRTRNRRPLRTRFRAIRAQQPRLHRRQELHRQPRARRARGHGLRATGNRRRRAARRPCVRRAVARRQNRETSCPASASRTTARRWVRTAWTTAGCGSTTCAWTATRCWTASGAWNRTATYVSPIKSDGARFFAIISALVGGRIGIAVAAISAAKSGLAIAVRYAERRRQFRTPGSEGETPLLQYPDPPAPAHAAARQRVRRGFHPQIPRAPARGNTGRPRPGGHARGRNPGRRDQGLGDLEHHAHPANVPRNVRRRGLHQRQPVARAQGRHGYFHDVRGRQHRAHALDRAQPARHRRQDGRRGNPEDGASAVGT